MFHVIVGDFSWTAGGDWLSRPVDIAAADTALGFGLMWWNETRYTKGNGWVEENFHSHEIKVKTFHLTSPYSLRIIVDKLINGRIGFFFLLCCCCLVRYFFGELKKKEIQDCRTYALWLPQWFRCLAVLMMFSITTRERFDCAQTISNWLSIQRWRKLQLSVNQTLNRWRDEIFLSKRRKITLHEKTIKSDGKNLISIAKVSSVDFFLLDDSTCASAIFATLSQFTTQLFTLFFCNL